MTAEKKEEIIIGTIAVLFSLLICVWGASLFYSETRETSTYSFFGIDIRGKLVAAIVSWLGFVFLFFSVRKTADCISHKEGA